MSLKKVLLEISSALALPAIRVLSLRGPARGSSSLSLLMEPDGKGVWRELIAEFKKAHPGTDVQLIEGPAATDTRETCTPRRFSPALRVTTLCTATSYGFRNSLPPAGFST